MKESAWLVMPPATGARMRLFCLPFAGGSAAFFTPWQAALGPELQVCAVQPPGRGARFGEAPLTDWSALLEQLTLTLSQFQDLPYALFGHSLGGLVAFELARAFAHQSLRPPCHLFVSATSPPQAQPNRPDITAMDDPALMARLRSYNGTPAEVLDHPELMELLLPCIRADLTLLQNYRYRPGPRLPVPITALAGRDDPHLLHEHLPLWQQETCDHYRQVEFAGDHFYLQPERDALLALLREELSRD